MHLELLPMSRPSCPGRLPVEALFLAPPDIERPLRPAIYSFEERCRDCREYWARKHPRPLTPSLFENEESPHRSGPFGARPYPGLPETSGNLATNSLPLGNERLLHRSILFQERACQGGCALPRCLPSQQACVSTATRSRANTRLESMHSNSRGQSRLSLPRLKSIGGARLSPDRQSSTSAQDTGRSAADMCNDQHAPANQLGRRRSQAQASQGTRTNRLPDRDALVSERSLLP